MLQTFLTALGVIWLGVEIGSFIENRFPTLGRNILFWPLMLSLFATLIMAVYILELRFFPGG